MIINILLFFTGISYGIYCLTKFVLNNKSVIIKIKVKYFLPLIILYSMTIISAIIMIPREIMIIINFSMYLSGFLLVYIFGIINTLIFQDPVIILNGKSPYSIPFIFFIIPTLIMTLIFIPKKGDIIIQFSCVLILFTITYFTGIYLMLYELKKDFNEKINNKITIQGMGTDKKKLVLINPVNRNKTGLSVNPSSIFPPLGLGIVAALTPANFDITLIDENVEEFSFLEADIVGITAFTSSANRAYEIASIYRSKNIPVIMGGIHASFNCEEALQNVDSIVIGEAESSWKNVIDDFMNNRLKKKYKGELVELVNIPIAKREIFSPKYLQGTIQTSRGCPMDCYFCSVTPFNGRKYRQRPVEEILNELETMKEKQIFFIDDNLLGYSKESERRAIDLFKGMTERKLDKEWFCQTSLNFGSNKEVLRWASKSGCRMVFIGLESSDANELKTMHKKLNLKLDYERAFRNINNHGIAVLGAFIYGSDAENTESMRNKTDYILKNRIDVVQTTILTPLPGTRQFEFYDQENRLLYKNFPHDWERYDMTELTYLLKNIENDFFIMELRKSRKKFYSNFHLFLKFFKTWINTGNITTAFYSYNSNKVYRNVSIIQNDGLRGN
jgi:radical SAM superfamily enzyme YgiQ (UPF0313 family)